MIHVGEVNIKFDLNEREKGSKSGWMDNYVDMIEWRDRNGFALIANACSDGKRKKKFFFFFIDKFGFVTVGRECGKMSGEIAKNDVLSALNSTFFETRQEAIFNELKVEKIVRKVKFIKICLVWIITFSIQDWKWVKFSPSVF